MWEFSLGNLSADITIPHFASLQRIGRAFASNFIDEDNTVARQIQTAPLPDVTFLSARAKSLEVNVWSQESAVNFVAPQGFKVHFNDYVSEGALSQLQVRAQSLQTRGLVQASDGFWLEVTSCEFGFVTNVSTSANSWKARQEEQQQFLAEQDLMTRRCHFLYEPEEASPSPSM